jgi:dethiobiotin synthetase
MAGGLMVPLNDTQLSLDLLKDWKFPVVLVANYYLGSINHTLLSIDVLRRYAIPIHSIVFNGTCVPASKEAILSYAKVKRYFEIPALDEINKETIKKYAQQIADHI